MGKPRFESVEDCQRHSARVRIACMGCGRTRTMTASLLMAMFDRKPKDWRFETIAPRLVCYKCGRNKPGLGGEGHGMWW